MLGQLAHTSRVFFRLLQFLFITTLALGDYLFRVWLAGRTGSYRARADWGQRWALRYLRFLRIEVSRRGTPPLQGFLTCNHLSYVDILVLMAGQPLVFVSKSQVQQWPLIGWLASAAGTLFLQREQKSDVNRVAANFAPIIEEGLPIALFLEGTSTDGERVLPFRSSLLEPAAAQSWPVTPGWIGYELAEGSVADEICYWRDMTFFPHFLNLLSKKRILAQVAYGEPLQRALNRKQMAVELRAEVCELANQFGREMQMEEPAWAGR